MRTAKRENECVVVSLFVNPTQFGPKEDFTRYPRNLERDAEMASQAGVDVLFAPPVSEMYPRVAASIHVPEVTERWEGAVRPGHFDGVATIVCKLFNIVRPSVAYFGYKDLQQCLVIKRMVEDLNLPVELSFQETTREGDGLAMSSRNAYLSPEDREKAPEIHTQLEASCRSIRDGKPVDEALVDARRQLESSGFSVDYLELVSLHTMEPLTHYTEGSAIIVAARLGKTRLIDNVRL
jgi:pantoate--beta-alanine ligase